MKQNQIGSSSQRCEEIESANHKQDSDSSQDDQSQLHEKESAGSVI